MIKYIILGIVQGITEFLPVSSSGHLVIMQKLLGISGQEVALTVVLHLGTSFALLIFFFKDIIKILKNAKMLFLIIIVTAVTAIIGLAGRDFFESLFVSHRFVAFALMFTGIILILTKRFMGHKRGILNIKDALVLGLAQGSSIIPGISRSGLTISTLLFRKIDRQTSFRFCFIASIPVVLAATILEAGKIGSALSVEFTNFLVGFICSLVSGILALFLLRIVLNKAKLYYFGYYCIIVGLVTLLFLK